MNNKKPKIVIVGAGSLFFGRQAVWAANQLNGLKGCTLSLVDNDPVHLEQMVQLAEMFAEFSGSGTVVEGHASYRDALPNADFVVLSFSERNTYYRGVDCRIAAKYGIRMCSGDTIGPGGLFRAMREFPKILEVADAVEKICPEAWLINYVNPSAIMGIGLKKYSKTKNFALCDSHHMPRKKETYLEMLGEDLSLMDDFELNIAGVNHFTFMLKAELKGVDIMPRILEAFRSLSVDEKDVGHPKRRYNNFITAQLADLLGAIPTCTGHTKEYVPYYQGKGAIQEPIVPLSIFDYEERDEITDAMWENISAYTSGEKSMSEFHESFKSDHATDIISTMVTHDGRQYYINRPNAEAGQRAVGNLPDDAFLELLCDLDVEGPRPVPVGEMPLGLRAQQMLILDVHELTIEAIVNRDRALLTRALAMDPLVNSIATAEAVIDELFEAEKEMFTDWPAKPENPFNVASAAAKPGSVPQLY